MDQDLKNKINNLSPDQLKRLMAKMGKKKEALPKMPRNKEHMYPVSRAQKRMWFLSKLNPESYLYTNPIAIKVRTEQPLDFNLWQQSFNTIVARHAIMRTSFSIIDNEIKQSINEQVESSINRLDLSGLGPKEKQLKLQTFLKKDGQTTISIEASPLFRHTVVQLDTNEVVLVYTSHHIISDAWSSSTLFREVLAVYNELIKDKIPAEKIPDYQFIDYVHWETNWNQSAAYKQALNSWRKMIPKAPETLNLPLDFKRPSVIDYQGGLIRSKLSKEFTQRLTTFSKTHDVNLFHTLLAAFNIVLNRYSGSREIVVGIPLANREIKEFQSTIGMFINTLPLKSDLDPSSSGLDYLRQLKESAQQVFFNQQFPFDQLIETINPVRDLSVSPIFQVLFVFQNIPSLYAMNGMHLEPIKPNLEVSKYELNLWVEEVNDELQLSLTYQTKLFKKDAITKLLSRYEFVLQSLMADSEVKIKELPIESISLSKPSFQFMEVTNTYLDGFQGYAALHPKAIAIYDETGGMSYEELEKQSNKIARLLRKTIKTESKVIAMLLDKTNLLLSTIMGIHKSGCAYLPLNEDVHQNFEYMLKDAKVDAIITNSVNLHYFNDSDQPVICLDIIEDAIEKQTEKALEDQPNVNDLAYIIYTSGSTGQPKGVQVEHKQVSNYAAALWNQFKLEPGYRCATVTSISTDLGNTQIFPVLANGGTVDLIPKTIATNPALFAGYISKHKVDTLKIVPSHLMSLLAVETKKSVLPRKVLILGGEKVTYALIKKIRNLDPDLKIMNHYGPTETTIGVLTHEIKDITEASHIPIGTALEGNQVLICNGEGKEIPDGIIGEITVFGTNVSRGYIVNQHTQKQNSFIVKDGVRGYRTGDLGRMNTEGCIEFFGRKDRQVKIRGYRTELGALEHMATTVEGVDQAVAINKKEVLWFYIKPSPGTNIEDMRLQSELKTKLPTYLQPFNITVVEDFPMLGNGKIDLQALSKLSTVKKEQKASQVTAPRDEVELGLLNIWKSVLNNECIGVEDNFFEIGGHSLLAIELIAKINEAYQTTFPIGILFEHYSIYLIAELIRSSKPSSSSAKGAIVLLRKGTTDKNLFIVHPAGGDVFAYYELANHISKGVNVYGLQSGVGQKDFESVELLASYYLEAIKAIEGYHYFAGWSMGALIAYEMAIQFEKQTGEQHPVILLDQKAPSLETEQIKHDNEEDRLVLFASKIEHLVNNKLNISKATISGKTALERSAIFLEAFKRNHMVPIDLKVEQFHGFLDKMIHHNEITVAYSGHRYDGPVLLIKAQDSTFVTDDFENSHDYGWSNYSIQNFKIVEVEGNHISMMRSPYISNTAKEISLQLENSSIVSNL